MTRSRWVWGFIQSHPIASSLIAGGLVIAALVFVPPVLVDLSGGGGLKGRLRVQAIANERRTVLAALAGLAAAVGLVYTALKHQLDRDSNVTERYTRAVEQLGHDSIAIRLGGLYSLDRIATDSPRDRETVLRVICAFIRDRTAAVTSEPTSTDVETAVTLVTRRRGWISDTPDLTGMRIPNARLYEADFSRSDLNDAVFSYARLPRAVFSGAFLVDANFRDAYLNGASFRDAYLTGADFTGAEIMGADFTGALLQGVVGLENAIGVEHAVGVPPHLGQAEKRT